MAPVKIKFGTSGWRGVIADDFTFDRVRIVTQAIADHITAQGLKEKGVLVGYDTRFLSERFAAEAVHRRATGGSCPDAGSGRISPSAGAAPATRAPRHHAARIR